MKVSCVPYFLQYQSELGHLVQATQNLVDEWDRKDQGAAEGLRDFLWEIVVCLGLVQDALKKSMEAKEDYIYVPREAAKKAGLI